jgi:hypothetical protein
LAALTGVIRFGLTELVRARYRARMSCAEIDLSLAEARRLALAAQGLHRPRPARVTRGALAATVRRLALLQLDFVNVVCPSHFIVPFSRLGPYDRRLLHDTIYGTGQFTEQWAHEASVIPMETWPLLRERMEVHRARPWGFDDIMRRHHSYVDTAMALIADRGPMGPADLPDPTHTGRRLPDSWYGSVPRAVLEACFGRGRLAVVNRRDDFSRVFDLADRAIPAPCFTRRVEPAEARRELLEQAARAHGIGTAADLADYFRMPVTAAKPRLAELVDDGTLELARVEGWREPAYLCRGSRPPRALAAAALLSPFDPVVWFRPRARRLFDFDYRFEIFIPEAKRKWGSYVLPFLLGERLVARVDLKAQRATGQLSVPGAYLEPHADPAIVAPALARELNLFARWLGLDGVRLGRRGNLSAALRRCL